ncbi:MAG: ParB/RepB/Spo0J family partition protein [Bacteroidetes bacterium]|nr:ParB/RepB/Spo0J family partition protein [Bacteroidota bacterium]
MQKNKELTKNKVLGRGLEALLGENINYLGKKAEIINIPIDSIETNPMQPRKFFDKQKLEELAHSIKENGIIQPITVRKNKNNHKYQLISGERRFRASKLAGIIELPAYIREVNDDQLLELALVENIQRANLNPIEISLSYQRLIEECSFTQEEIAQKVGKKRSTISNFLRILKLPLDIQVALKDEKITMGHAKALINLNDKNLQLKLLEKIIINNLSVRKAEELVRNIDIPKTKKITLSEEIKQNTLNIKNKLKTKFNTLVNIKINETNIMQNHKEAIKKGEIIIKFDSQEKFNEIVKIISNDL